MIIKCESRCKNRDAKTTAIFKYDGERKIMSEKKSNQERLSASKTKSLKKDSGQKKKVKKNEVEEIDQKKLLADAKKREKEQKIEQKKEKEVKKEVKKTEIKKEPEQQKKIKPIKKHGKKYRKIKEKIEKNKTYQVSEAIELIKDLSKTNFDPTLELHLRLDKKVENFRGVVNFPAGTPKSKKVLEIDDKNIDEVIKKVKSGKIDFDVMVAVPSVMPKLVVLAKVLGPKGMMPNPKNGTVSENVKKAADDFRSGKVEFKADKGNNLHFALAKVSYSQDKINQNFEAVLSAVPVGRVVSAYMNATMGPSIKLKIGN